MGKPLPITSGAIWLLAAFPSAAAIIPAGTEIQARLTTEVSSKAPSGQPVSAVVLAPVLVNNVAVVAPGTMLNGRTSDVTTAAAATEDQTEKVAQLRLNFLTIQGRPFSAVLFGVDNAREAVDDSGLVTGIKASQTYAARMDQGINKLADRYPDFAGILAGVKSAVVKPADPSIDFEPGVEVTLKLTQPLTWNDPQNQSVPELRSEGALTRLVAAQPLRTVAQKPPSPSDLTNLMFIGSREQLQAAFRKAGWFPADPLGRSANFETARAIIEDRGYNEAPVSILFLDGRPPDLVFQKQNDTFAMRHHIRIWQRPQTFDGQPVWIAAATHDIKISFSQASFNFTHGIDSNIDRERTKVTYDLEFTGLVKACSLFTRPAVPHDASNATGDALVTDGRIAVIEFL